MDSEYGFILLSSIWFYVNDEPSFSCQVWNEFLGEYKSMQITVL